MSSNDKVSTIKVHESTKRLIETKMKVRETFEDCIIRVFSQ